MLELEFVPLPKREGVFLLEECFERSAELKMLYYGEIYSGSETLFWKDRWLNGRALMFVWPDLFRGCGQHDTSFNELGHLLEGHSFCEDVNVAQTQDWLRMHRQDERDNKRWSLNGNGLFSMKSLYTFLNDGGLRCAVVNFF